MRHRRTLLLLLPLGLAVLHACVERELPTELAPGSASFGHAPGHCTVTSLHDDGGPGTLRALLADEDCATIDFAVTGTITLVNGQLDIVRDVEILGPGADLLTLDGARASRVMMVRGGVDATIEGVTVANGLVSGHHGQGGGLLVHGFNTVVTVRHSMFVGNEAGGEGGAIASFGPLTIEATTISGNAAGGGGGGIYLGGSSIGSTITGSTISNNTSGNWGGGLNNDNAAQTQLINSTISGNSATVGGGVYGAMSEFTLTHVTIVRNNATSFNGGIRLEGVGAMPGKTIIADNSAPVEPDCTFLGLTFNQGHNLIGNTSQCLWAAEPSDLLNVDPLLGPLADNGGPTQTHALLPGSPAIGHIPAEHCTEGTDQRGIGRPQGTGCDIGAFELEQEPPPPPTIQQVIAFFDDAAADGTLVGNGPGRSADNRLNTLRNMLVSASDLLAQGDVSAACGQLRQALRRSDGSPQPPDFVSGPAAPDLAAAIAELMDELGCP